MSDDIIEQYRQAIAHKQGISETTETPTLSVVTEVVKEPILPIEESDDPFHGFLTTLTKAIKEKAVIEKRQETEDLVRAAIEEATSDASIDEKVKEAALEFIEKLKAPEETTNFPTSLKKYTPKAIAKKINISKKPVQKIKPKIKEEAAEEIITVKKEPKGNTYVEQLEVSDKKRTLPEKVQKISNIKQLVSAQVKDEIEKIKIQISKMALESGGGSVAQQFAKGGTMNGDLNVTGKYLSGGTDLISIFSGGGGAADRLVSGSQSLILNPDGTINLPDLNGSDTNWLTAPDGELLNIESSTDAPSISGYSRITLSPYGFFAYDNNSNSISFSTADNNIVIDSQDQYAWTFQNDGVLVGPDNTLTVTSLSSLGRILSGGKDLSSIFLTAETDAQTLSFNENSEFLTISNGNSVALSSIRLAANSFASNNFLALSGGLVQGPVQINNNLTVFGNLTASGTTTFANTVFTTTSSLSVVHLGSGPALYVGNYGNDHIATFIDLQNNLEMLHIGGLSSSFPNIGVKTGNPNKDLTVRGEISASNTIYDNIGNSTQWNTAYNIGTAYQAISSTFLPNVRQFDYVQIDGNSYSYCGTAPYGALTSNSTWTIKRLFFSSVGTLLSSGTMNNSIWDNRYSYSY